MENVNRMYSKTELGLLYFPDATDKDTARRHIMVWIKRCKPLWRELEGMGYQINDSTGSDTHRPNPCRARVWEMKDYFFYFTSRKGGSFQPTLPLTLRERF